MSFNYSDDELISYLLNECSPDKQREIKNNCEANEVLKKELDELVFLLNGVKKVKTENFFNERGERTRKYSFKTVFAASLASAFAVFVITFFTVKVPPPKLESLQVIEQSEQAKESSEVERLKIQEKKDQLLIDSDIKPVSSVL